VLADAHLACHGGHLMPGCTVFACEFTVWAFEGDAPQAQAGYAHRAGSVVGEHSTCRRVSIARM